jgi:putative aminopeptidase FrvX
MSTSTQLKDLLRTFADACGVSGSESDVAEVLRAALAPVVDDVTVDTLGNVVGTRGDEGPTLMIAAHMDEIGAMVKYVDEQGFLRFVPIGGWFDQTILGQRVVVHGTKGRLTGVIGSKPPHIMEEDERSKPVKIKDMFVDIAARDAADAADLGVEIGSVVTMDRALHDMAHDFVTGKALDDRAGLVMMVAAMQRLKGRKLRARVHAVGTVQEEVGLKGAKTSAYGLDPDVALVSEVTIPGDHPEISKEQRHVAIGKGPVITVVDANGRGLIVPRPVLTWLRAAADGAGIPYQLDVASGGTTDATSIHLTRSGIPTGVVSVPTRYLHSPIEVLSLEDLERGAELIARAILSAHEHFRRR